MAPETRSGKERPTSVTTGKSAFKSAWRRTTRDSPSPFMRAVRTGKWKFIDRVQAGDPLYFDLVKDPGERAPSSDLGSELGKRSSQAYLEEVQALDAWYGRNPPRVLRTELPEDVQRGLRANGYVGDDDAPTAEPPRKE